MVRREGQNGAERSYELDHERPKSIGRLRGFQGNFGVFVRSYACLPEQGPSVEAKSATYSMAPPGASFSVSKTTARAEELSPERVPVRDGPVET